MTSRSARSAGQLEAAGDVAFLVDDRVRPGLPEQGGDAFAQYRVVVDDQHVHGASIGPIAVSRQGCEGPGGVGQVLGPGRDHSPEFFRLRP